MLSPMMIASSTTMPSTTMNANKLMVLMETPTAALGSSMKAPMKATGRPTATQMAMRRRRNRPKMMNTRAAPAAKFSSIRLMRLLR